MCILLFSTAHPDYPLVLLSNRDEFLHRPTARADYWEAPHEDVYSGRDLARPERGTWLGVSKNGRLAVLTNYREASSAAAIGEKSRGAMITSFLTSPEPVTTATRAWIHKVLETGEMKGVGGFSMMCGTLRPGLENLEELAVISNRTEFRDEGIEKAAHWVGGTKSQTRGLSNTLFDDPWPKVELGEKLLGETLSHAAQQQTSEDELIEQCFAVLSHNTLPVIRTDDTYESEIDKLKLSIFIPPFNAAAEHATTPHGHRAQTPEPHKSDVQTPDPEDMVSGKPSHLRANVPAALANTELLDRLCCASSPLTSMDEEERKRWRQSPRLYGTAQQTVILVDNNGRLKYIERTLFDRDARPLEGKDRDVTTEFFIEDWPKAQ